MREETILRKIRSGDPAGLEALMEHYLPYVSAVVWSVLRDAMPREDGEEVVSDVFLAAWRQGAALFLINSGRQLPCFLYCNPFSTGRQGLSDTSYQEAAGIISAASHPMCGKFLSAMYNHPALCPK